MTPRPALLPDVEYLPLKKSRGTYVVDEDAISGHNDREYQATLGDYLHRTYLRAKAQVELYGRRVEAAILLPPAEGERPYIAVDVEGRPLDAGSENAPDGDDIEAVPLVEEYHNSEWILPEQRRALWTGFVKPRLQLKDASLQTSERLPWDAVHNYSRMLLVGEAGSGKTSCLRRVALECVGAGGRTGIGIGLPVYVQLRNANATTPDIATIIQDAIVGSQASMGRGHSLFDPVVLLDGLDEIPGGARDAIVADIEAYCARTPGARVIVSSRPGVLASELAGFAHVELRPFTAPQIREWTYYAVRDIPSWRRLMAQLLERPEIAVLVRNPLLLSVATSLFIRNEATPLDKAQMLSAFMRMLIDDWDRHRGVVRAMEWGQSPRQVEILCSHLAFELAKAGGRDVGVEGIAERVSFDYGADVSMMLDLAGRQYGLVDRSGERRYRFRHRAVGEFFAAMYVVGSTRGTGAELRKVLDRESRSAVAALACGVTPDANELVEDMLRTRDVSASGRAESLAEAFTQKIAAKNDLVVTGLELILSVLGDEFKGARRVPDAELVRGGGVGDRWVRAWGWEGASRWKKDELRGLRRMLEYIYRMRSGVGGKLWGEVAGAAKSECVRDLGGLMEAEGRLVVTVNMDTGGPLMIARVREENIRGLGEAQGAAEWVEAMKWRPEVPKAHTTLASDEVHELVVLRPRSDILEGAACDELERQLFTPAEQGRRILVDLSATHVLTANALGVLARAQRLASANGGGLALCGAASPQRWLLDVTHLAEALPFYDSEAEAVAHLNAGRGVA